MVDPERLARLIARVSADIADLRATGTADLLRDELRLRAVKYSFVTAIEGCARAAQHVLSSEAMGMPDSNAAAIRMLGEHGVIDSGLADRVSLAVGFRNVLVHEYAEVDDARVVANLSLLDDLDAFVGQLASWAAER